jgi:hypothetical protein
MRLISATAPDKKISLLEESLQCTQISVRCAHASVLSIYPLSITCDYTTYYGRGIPGRRPHTARPRLNFLVYSISVYKSQCLVPVSVTTLRL